MKEKTIALASDHGGYTLKEAVKGLLLKEGYPIEDLGPHGPESVDYPDYGAKLAARISEGEFSRGILACGTGIGMSIVANKFPHVRGALCHDLYTATMSRQHNDANILILGGRILETEMALEIVKTWLNTPFEGERHSRRLEKIKTLDENLFSLREPGDL
ncbi:MAG: ribose 5-phosphate isomerase B [Candidatus Tectomicrobia bacterium]|uniref:Ribose 5-phosphate isomerase B n=1 Tax=Tectimicrobiota bacterium TaxID=2528274 RepID=A0A932CLW1_UNCTE|nr:ribose 5-phosphate isomerase B [Candidatus Tectomicrobia bacterium]